MVDMCLDMSMLLRVCAERKVIDIGKVAVFALEKKYINNTLSIYSIYE